MLLRILHPLVAFRDCQHCLAYQYDETTGRPQRSKADPSKFLKRYATIKPRCQTAKGCPKGTPENQKGFTEQNRLAYEHYKQCLAVSHFPDDPVVRRNAYLIQQAEEDARRLLSQ